MIDKKAAKLSLSAVLLLVLTAVVSTFGCSDDNGGGKVKPVQEWDYSYFKNVAEEACMKQVKCGIKDDDGNVATKESCEALSANHDSKEAKADIEKQMEVLAACDGGFDCCLMIDAFCVMACTKNLSCNALTAAQKDDNSAANDPALLAEGDALAECLKSCRANDRCPELKPAQPKKKGD